MLTRLNALTIAIDNLNRQIGWLEEENEKAKLAYGGGVKVAVAKNLAGIARLQVKRQEHLSQVRALLGELSLADSSENPEI